MIQTVKQLTKLQHLFPCIESNRKCNSQVNFGTVREPNSGSYIVLKTVSLLLSIRTTFPLILSILLGFFNPLSENFNPRSEEKLAVPMKKGTGSIHNFFPIHKYFLFIYIERDNINNVYST